MLTKAAGCETAIRVLVAAFAEDPVARWLLTGGPAHLEASSARNLPLFERHGFHTTGDPITLPGGPRLRPMWRAARP